MDNEEYDWIDSRRSLFYWLSKRILDYPDIIQPTRKHDFSGLYEELARLSEGCVIERPKSLWRLI